MTGRLPREVLTSRARLGGYAAAANLSPEERSERARRAVQARWAAENARRAAEGLPPTKKTEPLLSAEELEPWLEEVDRRYPKRQWPNKEARRRQALLLARQAAAQAAQAALRGRDG